MKNMLKGSNGTHFSARVLRSSAVAITGVALGFALWTATAPISVAQDASPEQALQSALGGRTMANASRPQLIAAVQRAIRSNRNAAPEIVGIAITARPELAAEILRAAFGAIGTGRQNCPLLERTLRAAIAANPDQAAELTELANSLAPNCRFDVEPGPGGGGFDGAPGNLNPPPGSIGGGGGQGNLVAVCHNGFVIFVSPNAVQAHLNHGDTLGACQVTPSQNQ